MWIQFVLLVITAYFLGSIPTAYIITKIVKNEDIRNLGSGNVGATNVFRSVGKFYGVLTLVLDAFKGFLAVKICMYLFPEHVIYQIIIAVSAILGHGFSVFLKGKGGKSVATTLGVFIAMASSAIFFTFVIFVAVVGLFGYISVGSIVGAVFLPIALTILNYDKSLVVFGIILGLYIIYKHKANILRLIEGEEDKFIKS